MNRFLSFFVLLEIFTLPCYAIGQEKETIVHEAWSVHMESAGGWVAMDKGFYGKVKVKEVQGGPGISPIQEVVAAMKTGNIAFGNDYPENLIRAREKEGIDLVALSVDFQTSAMRIISWRPIKSAKDIKGDFGIWTGYDAKAKCAVGKGWEKQFTIQNQGADIKPWLAGTWPMASAMTYNELITAQREMKKMGKPFYTVDYKDLGIDWMDNVLFTTGEILKKYPDVVQAVVTGRYKGFQWALENPRETFDILAKINDGLNLAHEMDAVGPIKALMITPDSRKNGFGYILPKKWDNMAKDMFRGGLLEKMPDVKKSYTEKFPSGVFPK
ncbi:MAG TPA: ABC transporter substrate-binding protein [Thermodesulfobacteriota bacterium]|nr:ABC transporter substrate-binding protein [Thermodesulfobacteriota bacterium]